MADRVSYKLGIDTITPAPTGAGGDLVIDNFKAIADHIETIQNDLEEVGGAHTHTIADVTGLQTALDDKATTSQIAAINSELDTKADADHEHVIADVTGLQTALDGKAGTAHSHDAATTGAAGFMSAADKTKLSGIASGATANSSDATLLSRANHTGSQSADTITDGTTNKVYTATEKTKLAGIAAGATVNSSDAILLARANHTGSQAISTITNLQSTLDNKVNLATGGQLGDSAVIQIGDDTNYDNQVVINSYGLYGSFDEVPWSLNGEEGLLIRSVTTTEHIKTPQINFDDLWLITTEWINEDQANINIGLGGGNLAADGGSITGVNSIETATLVLNGTDVDTSLSGLGSSISAINDAIALLPTFEYINSFLPLGGGTMTGTLYMSGQNLYMRDSSGTGGGTLGMDGGTIDTVGYIAFTNGTSQGNIFYNTDNQMEFFDPIMAAGGVDLNGNAITNLGTLVGFDSGGGPTISVGSSYLDGTSTSHIINFNSASLSGGTILLAEGGITLYGGTFWLGGGTINLEGGFLLNIADITTTGGMNYVGASNQLTMAGGTLNMGDGTGYGGSYLNMDGGSITMGGGHVSGAESIAANSFEVAGATIAYDGDYSMVTITPPGSTLRIAGDVYMSGTIAMLRPQSFADMVDAPDATANEGMIVYDADAQVMKFSNGTTWVEM